MNDQLRRDLAKRHVHSAHAHELPEAERSGGLIVQYRHGTLNFTCPCGLRWTWGKTPYKGVNPVVPEKEYLKDGRLWRGVCTCGNVVWKRAK